MHKRMKIAEAIETTEKPNIALLRRAIFQVPSFASRNMIPKAIDLVNAADSNSELVRVTWQMSSLGILAHQVTGVSSRLYPVGASMATLDRKNCAMRYIAQYGRVIPIDISNCHPTIMADSSGNEAITAYVENKAGYRTSIAAHYDVSEEHAKELMLRLTYGGTINAWAKRYAPKCNTHSQLALDYMHGVSSHANKLVGEYKPLVECIMAYRDPRDGSRKKNVPGCTTSYVNQGTERKMTDAMRTVPREVQSTLHDEVMFTMKDDDDDDTIRELEEQCTNAIQDTLKGAKCEAKLPELPEWFDPDKTLFFEQFQTFSASMYEFAAPMDELSAMELTAVIIDETGKTITLATRLSCGGTIYPPKLLGMQLSFTKDGLREALEEDEATSLTHGNDEPTDEISEDQLVQEAQKQEQCIKLLSISTYHWWFDHFFAQGSNDSGHVYEFTYTSDGRIDDFYTFHTRDMMTKYAPLKKQIQKWLAHPRHRMITGVGFYPRVGTEKAGFVNTWSGLPHTPVRLDSLVDPDLARVRMLIGRIHSHWRVIMASGNDVAYNYLRKWYSYVTQGRGKTRVFLQFLSEMFQGGKGAFNVDLMSKVLGKYFYAPNCGLDSPNGLLGRFTYPYMNKLLICADELGEMIFNKKGRSDMRCWLTRTKGEYKKECCPPVYIDDHANLVANTNEILATHTESDGDCRNAIFMIDERYTKHSAEKGLIVDGEPMTMQRRRDYFTELYEAINDPLTIAAFTHELLNEECADFDFQDIPETDIRMQLKEVYDEKSWVGDFLSSWANSEIFWHEDGSGGSREVRVLTPLGTHSATFVYTGLTSWASRNNDRVPLQKCRSHQQLGIQLREYIASGAITKRASNGRTLYRLSELAVNASMAAKASELNAQETVTVTMNDF